MALNKFNKKKTIQVMLLSIGILLVFLTYFSNPIKNKNQKALEDVSGLKDIDEKDKDVSVFENLEYRGTDSAGNKFVIFSEYSDFKQDRSEIVNMRNIVCYFYFKDSTVLEIRSRIGTYNNVTLDMSFAENVNMFYMDNSLSSDKADFINADNRLTIEGNVKTQGSNGDLVADILDFDFFDKKMKVSMYSSEEKVKIKTKTR